VVECLIALLAVELVSSLASTAFRKAREKEWTDIADVNDAVIAGQQSQVPIQASG